jgi:hypothetical protein
MPAIASPAMVDASYMKPAAAVLSKNQRRRDTHAD